MIHGGLVIVFKTINYGTYVALKGHVITKVNN
jgi:hypothetical protein